MTFERAFLDLMPHTITITTAAAQDRYGVRTWSTAPTSYRARVVPKQQEVRTPNGQTVASSAIVYVASTGTITPEDRIRLPAGTLPTTAPPILLAESFPDEDGTHHYKLTLGF